ncbi:hypothetical protein PRZ48_011354 [Zasmidium cellare]|uniref:Major facilitator superfamily (MFS) profile domain-containing protein n=1 Tax=Zasmidium cellare TaxID=395010 RepID=A0ABR0E6B6_ZASCE|nr:hypothetical protein PRZ48_011354 [Zasmidium cellare]
MALVLRPFVWFYHEFGLVSVYDTGGNAWLIILARSLRMFAYGTNSLILALFFAEIGFSDSQLGLFMTLTLLGDVFLGTALTLVADKVGRRRILLMGSALMVLTGCIFAYFENFWILLFAAVVGVVSATGGDFGPFRSIEESILSQISTPTTRADVLAWYVTLSALGSTTGSEASGRIIEALQSRDGWTLADAYHSIWWVYAVFGFLNAGLVLLLSKACEAESKQEKYAEVPQDESEDNSIELVESPARPDVATLDGPTLPPPPKKSRFSWLSGWIGNISTPTLSVMWKLWALLAVDSLADGMVPYSLTNYYMDDKFHPSKAALGDVTSVSYFLSAVGGVFAGPMAKKIGLVNTMVFTHIPSSAAVLVFPLPNMFWMTAVLLFVRAGLNNMDQAPRSALIAAIVKPEERTAVMGITSMIRTLAATAGPTVTGLLAGSNRFWIAFVAGGAFRLAYDIGLWVIFVNIKLHQHEETRPEMVQTNQQRPGEDNEEIGSLAGSDDDYEEDDRATK